MSYRVACSYRDTTIKTTRIYDIDSGALLQTLTHKGETVGEDDITFYADYSTNVKFRATPINDYTTVWVYRINGGEQQFHYAPEFPYTEQLDIQIRAEGRECIRDTLTYTVVQTGINILTVKISTKIANAQYYIYVNSYLKSSFKMPSSTASGSYDFDIGLDNPQVGTAYQVEVVAISGDYFHKPNPRDIVIKEISSGGDGETGSVIPISGFIVEQTNVGVKEAKIQLIGENIEKLLGGTYVVYAEIWEKASGTIDESIINDGLTIEFDNFGTFNISLEIVLSDGNKFTFMEQVEICDKVETERPPYTSYFITSSDIGNLSKIYYREFEAGSFTNTNAHHQVYRYSMTFERSGRALFYTTTNNNYILMDLSKDTEWVYHGSKSVLEVKNPLAFSHSYGPLFTCEVKAGETYYIWMRSDYGDNHYSEELVIVPPVPLWDWESNTDKINAYKSLTSNGHTDDFKYTIWNELVDIIRYIAEADPYENALWLKAYNDDGFYLSSSQAKMKEYDKIMTADRFNAIRYNIGARLNAPSTGIESKKPGDPVIGREFITLTDCLNGWITTLFNKMK